MWKRQPVYKRRASVRTVLLAGAAVLGLLSGAADAKSAANQKPSSSLQESAVQFEKHILTAQAGDENQHNNQDAEQVNSELDAQIEAQIDEGPGEDLADNGSDLENEEMSELASELGESFAMLHKSGSVASEGKNADFAAKTQLCAATRFSERKSVCFRI